MGKTFSGKNIVVGVTGSIAAFKVAGWVSTLAKEEAHVTVIMTTAAQEFISPLTFSALTGRKTYTAMFDGHLEEAMSHIEIAQAADLFLIAPASAQTISRLANGMADDLLSTTVLATRAPVVLCPSMNPQMYAHKATQNNISKLQRLGYTVMEPACGLMACKDEGQGRLVEWSDVQEMALRSLGENDLAGQKVLITAGPTQEPLDPARFLSNRSSGKMGYAMASTAYRRGAEVLLISGPTALECPFGVERLEVVTAEEMYATVTQNCREASIIVKAAAVSDFRPENCFSQKVKKENAENTIALRQNPDILAEIGTKYKLPNQILVGFAAESDNIEEEGAKKLQKKNLDFIAVNDISSSESGFAVNTNRVTLMTGEQKFPLPLTTKTATADLIWDHIVLRVNERQPKS